MRRLAALLLSLGALGCGGTDPGGHGDGDADADADADGDVDADGDADADPCAGVSCAELDGNCVVGTCDPVDATCSAVPAAAGATCDDGDPDTSLDTCGADGCAGVPCPADPHEDDDTTSEATAVAMGSNGGLQLCPGDPDYFAVDTLPLVQTYRISTSDGAGGCAADTVVELLGADGTTSLGSDDDGGIAPCSSLVASAVRGRAFVTVRGVDASAIGPYALDVVALGEHEPNDTVDVADRIADGSFGAAASIGEPGDTDLYAFAVTGGCGGLVEVSTGDDDQGCATSATVDLLREDGVTLVATDGAEGRCGALRVPVDAGNYVLRVGEAGNDAAGAYHVSVLVTNLDGTPEVEPNGDAGLATGGVGPFCGSIAPIGDTDFFDLHLRCGGDLTIDASDGFGGCGTESVHVRLFDALFGEIALGGVDGECAHIEEHGLAAGVYSISVADFDTNASIPRYLLEVHTNEGDAEPNDDAPSAAGPLIGAARACGALDAAGDADVYSVGVGPGGTVRAETLADAGVACPVDTAIELLDQDGTTVLASNDDDGGDTCSLLDPTADAAAAGLSAGTYYLRVTSPRRATGPYVLDVVAD